MSKLDRAFIKIYSQSHGQRAVPAHHVSTAAVKAQAAHVAAPAQVAAPAGMPTAGANSALPPVALATPGTAPVESNAGLLPVDTQGQFESHDALQPPHWDSSRTRALFEQTAPADSTAGPDGALLPVGDSQPRIKPAFEVDRFAWPKMCGRLITRTANSLDAIAKGLLAGAREGRKVIAVSGCNRKEGRTTVLLCLAQRLAAIGVRAALVDADFESPALAMRLGMAAQLGWDDLAGSDRHISEALIESMQDHLVLLPLRKPADGRDETPANLAARRDIRALREDFNLILVDAGPFCPSSAQDGRTQLDAGIPSRPRGWEIDAALLIRDLRATHADNLTELADRLRRDGVLLAGIAENFAT